MKCPKCGAGDWRDRKEGLVCRQCGYVFNPLDFKK